jgi:Ubiquitin-activating enzyme E1 FCCH domain
MALPSTPNLEICNSGLTMLGTRTLASMSDTSKESKLLNMHWDTVRLAVLRGGLWNFAKNRVQLTTVNITNCANNGSGLIRVTTATAHNLVTGNYVSIEQVMGTSEANVSNNLVTKIDANNFDIQGSTFSNVYISGGICARAPAFGFKWMFALPGDYVRLVMLSDTDENPIGVENPWQIEGGYLLTNMGTVNMRYLYDAWLTTSSFAGFDPLFAEALAAALAIKIAYAITAAESRVNAIHEQLKNFMQQAKYANTTDNPSPEFDDDVWLRSRLGVPGWVRDPMT